MKKKKVIIMGAGGRDLFYHQRFFKNSPEYKVVAFTAAQIPGIAHRLLPMRLAGVDRNTGIWIYPEEKLEYLIECHKKDGSIVEVHFAYSDVSWDFIKSKQKEVESLGAEFVFDLARYRDIEISRYKESMLTSLRPVIAVTALRTGCGKGAVMRCVAQLLKDEGFRPVIVRHPMAYGDLLSKANDVQVFACGDDLNKCKCTFEEREEYEPLITAGFTVYAGLDYEKVLGAAEQGGDIIIWDGGNNDLPFFKPNVWITVVDPHRFEGEIYPHGLCNLKNADIALINKIRTAKQKNIDIGRIKKFISDNNHAAQIIETDLEITISSEDKEFIKGKPVVAIEDGPTVTHGGMSFGAAVLAAERNQCILINPYPYLRGSLVKTFNEYPHLMNSCLLPNIGYKKDDIQSLQDTINNIVPRIEAVLVGTPIDLSRFLKLNNDLRLVPVKYELDFIAANGNEFIYDDFGKARFRAEIREKMREVRHVA